MAGMEHIPRIIPEMRIRPSHPSQRLDSTDNSADGEAYEDLSHVAPSSDGQLEPAAREFNVRSSALGAIVALQYREHDSPQPQHDTATDLPVSRYHQD